MGVFRLTPEEPLAFVLCLYVLPMFLAVICGAVCRNRRYGAVSGVVLAGVAILTMTLLAAFKSGSLPTLRDLSPDLLLSPIFCTLLGAAGAHAVLSGNGAE